MPFIFRANKEIRGDDLRRFYFILCIFMVWSIAVTGHGAYRLGGFVSTPHSRPSPPAEDENWCRGKTLGNDTALAHIATAPKSIRLAALAQWKKARLSSHNGAHTKLQIEIIQHISNRSYLVSHSGETIYLITGRDDYSDGDHLSCCIKETGDLFEYTNSLGASCRVRKYISYAPPPAPDYTPENFIDALKAGEQVALKRSISQRCPECGGRTSAKRISCTSCKGAGKTRKNITLTLVWEPGL